jgi:hypothetical protein
MRKVFIAAFTAALLLSAVSAFAQEKAPSDYPLFAKERLSFGVRTEYAWWSQAGGSPLVLPFKKEFGIGIPASYALTAKRFPDGHVGPPALALTFRAVYFVDSRVTNYAIGLNLALYEGGK